MEIEFLSEYLEFIEIEKGLSANTVEAYRRDMLLFMNFCSAQGVNCFSQIERKYFNSYLLYLRNNNYEPTSIARKLASMRGFFKWLCANNYIKFNPAQTLEQAKLPKKLPKVMTPEEIDTIFRQNLNTTELLIVELLYDCGLRASELVNLKISNVDLKSKYIQCYGKGSKERVVPFGKKAKDAISKYLNNLENIKTEKPNDNQTTLWD